MKPHGKVSSQVDEHADRPPSFHLLDTSTISSGPHVCSPDSLWGFEKPDQSLGIFAPSCAKTGTRVEKTEHRSEADIDVLLIDQQEADRVFEHVARRFRKEAPPAMKGQAYPPHGVVIGCWKLEERGQALLLAADCDQGITGEPLIFVCDELNIPGVYDNALHGDFAHVKPRLREALQLLPRVRSPASKQPEPKGRAR